MQYRELGTTGVKVSRLCLGSMTWGSQNTAAEGHEQIAIALDAGVNFIDTAEMYPTNPVRAETIGGTETIIGDYLARAGGRDRVFLATKITGRGQALVREGAPITAATLRIAIEGSLRRLRTEVIDLYQLHWPNRGSYQFRQNWTFDASRQDSAETRANMAEVLAEMQRQVAAGRVRFFGLSNESAWGTMSWLHLAEATGGPRVQTVQNEYSLLCRHFDTDMSELAHHEKVDLIAFSPVAAGLLSGKYAADVTPPGSRRSFTPELGGRISPRVWAAIDAYLAIARRHGLDPCQMALAWCLTRPFMGAAIFGATSPAQLRGALGAADLTLSAEVLAEISVAHRAHPMPF